MEFDNGLVWREAIERRWGSLPENAERLHWRSVYVRKARIEQLWLYGAYTTTFLPAEAFGVRLMRHTKAVCWDTRGNVFVFDIAQRREERRIHAHDERIWWLAVSSSAASDSGLCITASGDRTLRVLDLAGADPPAATIVRTLRGHRNAVWCVDFNESADIVASGSDKEELCIWRLSTGEHVHTVRCAGVVGWYDVKVVPAFNGRPLIVAAARQCVVLIDPERGEVSAVLDRSKGRLPNFLAATPDVHRGVVYASDTMRRLRMWSLYNKRLVGEVALPGIAECVVLFDNKLFTGIDENGLDFYVRVWALGKQFDEPEHLYDVRVDLPKGSRRLYAVEVLEDAIVCCTQAEQLIIISANANSKLPKRKKSKSPFESGLASSSTAAVASAASSSSPSTSSSSASSAAVIARRSVEQHRLRQQQQLQQLGAPQLATSPTSCILS